MNKTEQLNWEEAALGCADCALLRRIELCGLGCEIMTRTLVVEAFRRNDDKCCEQSEQHGKRRESECVGPADKNLAKLAIIFGPLARKSIYTPKTMLGLMEKRD